jgi:acetamidase/formamidase
MMRTPLLARVMLVPAVALVLLGTARPAEAAVHDLKATPTTVHRGFFDASLPPVLTIDSGDIVRLETSTGNPRYFEHLGVPKEKIPKELFAEYEGVDNDGRGDHTLDGPIYVTGAEPGDAIEIKILKVAVRLPIAAMSFRPTRGVLPDEFTYQKDRVFWIDMKHQTVEFAPGVKVPVKPFWGVMAVAPEASRGRVPSGPPDIFGGNLDNRDLGAGSSLFLPVQTKGGLVSIGDGHAVQGDGEVGLSAVEGSLKGEVQIILHKGMKLHGPRAETPTHYMAIGLSPDLNIAAHNATSDMVNFLATEKGLSRDDAYMLCSAAMDLIISEAVDGTKGVHAVIPKAIFSSK